MSTQKGTSVGMLVVIAAVSAVIGFGAIYVIAGAGDNGAGGQQPVLASETPRAPAAAPTAKRADLPAQKQNVSPKHKSLSKGTMATFVFKDAPSPLPKVSFNGPDGQPLSLENFKGKVVLLNLWATWCAPCKLEMPHLDKLKAKLGSDRFDVVTVSVDRGSPDKPRKFFNDIKISSLALYHDPEAQIGFTLMAIGMPTTLLIDPEGREIGRLVGPAEWDSPDAINLIRAHLAAAPPD